MNFPDLNKKELSVLKNFIRILISEKIEIITISKLLEDPKKIGLPLVFVRPVLDALIEKQILTKVQFDGLQHIGLNSEHVDWFYDLAFELGLIEEDQATLEMTLSDEGKNDVPAADRFVSLNHNQPELENTKNALKDLSDAIMGANDLFATADDRLQISKQVDYLTELVSTPRIHVLSIWDAAKNNSTLKWLIEQSASVVVRDLASKAIHALSHLLSSLS